MPPENTTKEFISAKMDTHLIQALAQYARDHGMSRSAALRIAIANLVGLPVE